MIATVLALACALTGVPTTSKVITFEYNFDDHHIEVDYSGSIRNLSFPAGAGVMTASSIAGLRATHAEVDPIFAGYTGEWLNNSLATYWTSSGSHAVFSAYQFPPSEMPKQRRDVAAALRRLTRYGVLFSWSGVEVQTVFDSGQARGILQNAFGDTETALTQQMVWTSQVSDSTLYVNGTYIGDGVAFVLDIRADFDSRRRLRDIEYRHTLGYMHGGQIFYRISTF